MTKYTVYEGNVETEEFKAIASEYNIYDAGPQGLASDDDDTLVYNISGAINNLDYDHHVIVQIRE